MSPTKAFSCHTGSVWGDSKDEQLADESTGGVPGDEGLSSLGLQ